MKCILQILIIWSLLGCQNKKNDNESDYDGIVKNILLSRLLLNEDSRNVYSIYENETFNVKREEQFSVNISMTGPVTEKIAIYLSRDKSIDKSDSLLGQVQINGVGFMAGYGLSMKLMVPADAAFGGYYLALQNELQTTSTVTSRTIVLVNSDPRIRFSNKTGHIIDIFLAKSILCSSATPLAKAENLANGMTSPYFYFKPGLYYICEYNQASGTYSSTTSTYSYNDNTGYTVVSDGSYSVFTENLFKLNHGQQGGLKPL